MKTARLSKAETEIMAVLWRPGAGTIAQLQAALDNRMAYTTIATHLTRMQKKGTVTSHKMGRAYIFEPTEARDDFSTSRLGELVRQFFDGKASSLASHFIQTNSFSDEELEELKQLIEQKAKK